MSIDLGDIYPLSINIYDIDRKLANATSVELTISLPDGTTQNVGVISPSTVGSYSYDFVTTQVGRHNAYWVATGVNASAFTDSFYVEPVDSGEFISLQQFKAHIKKSGNSEDDLIRSFIGAACQMITNRMGHISPTPLVEDVSASYEYVSLKGRPLLEVQSVQRLPGLEAVPNADPSVSLNGWHISLDTGILYLGSRGRFRVTYRAGLATIPKNYILAALELTTHLWKTSQQNAGGGRPAVGIDETVVVGVTYALPYTVRQLLGLDKRPQKGVFVG